MRLGGGYVTEVVQDDSCDLLAQLEAILPFKDWQEVLCCTPGNFEDFGLLVSSTDLANTNPRTQARFRLDSPGYHNRIFHNESKGLGKQQLVIVRR